MKIFRIAQQFLPVQMYQVNPEALGREMRDIAKDVSQTINELTTMGELLLKAAETSIKGNTRLLPRAQEMGRSTISKVIGILGSMDFRLERIRPPTYRAMDPTGDRELEEAHHSFNQRVEKLRVEKQKRMFEGAIPSTDEYGKVLVVPVQRGIGYDKYPPAISYNGESYWQDWRKNIGSDETNIYYRYRSKKRTS